MDFIENNTIHLGKNPTKGGRPPKERRRRINDKIIGPLVGNIELNAKNSFLLITKSK